MTRKSGRDESIEHLLKNSLQEPWQAPASSACPDAEILAAWTDGVLEGRELAMTREHVAQCVSCQATLAVLARTAPPDPAPLPWWQRVPSVRWLVPVAATATAVAIWVAVPRDEYTQPAQPTALARDSAVPQPESMQAAAQPPAAADDSANRAAAPSPAAPSTAELELETAQKAEAREGFERQDSRAPAREEAAAAPPEPTTDTAAGALARQEAVTAPAAPPAPAAQSAAPAPGQATGLGARGALLSRMARSVVVASPGTMLRWRLGNAGSVEYSTDAGRTWEARPTGVDEDLVAGASPSGTVCWIVGRAGTVLLTINGADWRRLTPPATLDFTAVEATDARTAILTAANGQRFRTTDGGTTWESL